TRRTDCPIAVGAASADRELSGPPAGSVGGCSVGPRLMRQERVTKDLIPLRAFGSGSGSASEHISRGSDLDADEPRLFEHPLPTLTGQPPGDSTGPEVDIAQSFRWY